MTILLKEPKENTITVSIHPPSISITVAAIQTNSRVLKPPQSHILPPLQHIQRIIPIELDPVRSPREGGIDGGDRFPVRSCESGEEGVGFGLLG